MVYECDKCKTALPSGAKFCPKCGAIFKGVVPADAEAAGLGFTPRPASSAAVPHTAAYAEKWQRVRRILAPVIIFAAIAQGAISCFLLYVLGVYQIPQNFDTEPDWIASAENHALYTLAYCLLPTLVLLCVWVIAAVSRHQALDVQRLRMAYVGCFCYMVSWILIIIGLFGVAERFNLPAWFGSDGAGMVFTLCTLAGSVLSTAAVISRRKT